MADRPDVNPRDVDPPHGPDPDAGPDRDEQDGTGRESRPPAGSGGDGDDQTGESGGDDGDIPSRLRDLGGYIRSQRTSAQLSLRNLAKLAGVSNPYLSQIERGLRKPSAEILQAIAKALSISAETLYVKAGILDERDPDHDLESAIARDPHLTESQRKALTEMYRSFRRLAELRQEDEPATPETDAPPAGGKGPLRGLIDAARALGESASGDPTAGNGPTGTSDPAGDAASGDGTGGSDGDDGDDETAGGRETGDGQARRAG